MPNTGGIYMGVSKPIGYTLIAAGVLGLYIGLKALADENGFVMLFGIGFIIAALVLAGIGAIAIKK